MKNSVILVTKPGLGATAAEDADFGVDMLDKLFHTLETQPEKPTAICFYTEGVRMVVAGSPVVLSLKLLASQGIRLAICQSCLERYGLLDQVAVGDVIGMKQIVQLMAEAEKVITV
jgi:intracellular sulfur oxidation DsrE/DsrF family protein